MTSQEIIKNYLAFFGERGHKLIPNVPLVPENDPTLLFVNSGVFPLVPYVFGEKHPEGNRLMNFQRCVRFDDLENVGESNRHTVAFHMLGNWSLGDYFKKEQLPWIYEFFIEVLGLDVNKLYATVFKGDEDAPKDEESIEILKTVFAKYGVNAKENEKIFAYGKENTWWKRGDAVGEPGGPSCETFYYIGKDGTGAGLDPEENQDLFIEIGNSVFMQYKKGVEGWEPLPQKNVDFGGGLERIALAAQGKQDIFETDNFWPIIQKIEELSGKKYGEAGAEGWEITKQMRIIADHMRTAVFLAMDEVVPSNKDQGYMLRRLLRRMVRAGRKLNIPANIDISVELVGTVVDMFSWTYPQLEKAQKDIQITFTKEEVRFAAILEKGARQVDKFLSAFKGSENDDAVSKGNEVGLAEKAFEFYESTGYPLEIFIEDVKDKGIVTAFEELENRYKEKAEKHSEKSREGAEHKFKGGLADQSDQVVKYHTTTHLVHWALRKVLGEGVKQQGSNITGERLRFDFSHDKKLTESELSQVVNLVNEKISENLQVNMVSMPREQAEKVGALSFFQEKYGDMVNVYYIGDTLETAISKEFCGGPHVKNTSELAPIEIYKQDKIGEGVIRVYVRVVQER